MGDEINEYIWDTVSILLFCVHWLFFLYKQETQMTHKNWWTFIKIPSFQEPNRHFLFDTKLKCQQTEARCKYTSTDKNSLAIRLLYDYNLFCHAIFTNSAPLGRVGHRVAMSVCVCVCLYHCKTPTSGGRVDLWSKIAFIILVWDDTIFKKTGGPICWRNC